MENNIVVASICCTCLSRDRKLFPLKKLQNWNSIYQLILFNRGISDETFSVSNLHLCWECEALTRKYIRFCQQADAALKLLSEFDSKMIPLEPNLECFSQLDTITKSDYDKILNEDLKWLDENFVNCGISDIKSEELNYDDNYHDTFEEETNDSLKPEKKLSSRKAKLRLRKKRRNYSSKIDSKLHKEYFTEKILTESEMLMVREEMKQKYEYLEAEYKCEDCIKGFHTKSNIEEHALDVHIKRGKHIQCDICQVFVKKPGHDKHRLSHYQSYMCQLCDNISYDYIDILKHLQLGHLIKNIKIPEKREKRTKNPGSKPRRNQAMLDKKTPLGFPCFECNKYFENKNKRWKHIQREHREGFQCGHCGKKFAFKNTLNKHEQLHQGPMAREKCQICHKMIRCDLIKVHTQIHEKRQKYHCEDCQKTFACLATYEHHMKYTKPHSNIDVLKYRCSMCEKGYRSRGELRDHINYQHMGKTQHKCPICGKALATKRCITRHINRAHAGKKEQPRDKVCGHCGKTFRDKKGLMEHEFIHTGERPLSCEVCGMTFRQNASLYTHKKRIHKIFPPKKTIELMEPTNPGRPLTIENVTLTDNVPLELTNNIRPLQLTNLNSDIPIDPMLLNISSDNIITVIEGIVPMNK